MFVIQSCCLKSDMDVLTAYFGLYLSQKAFRLLAFKFSHIFDLSHIFGNVPQILPFLVFLWYVFNLCKPPKTNFDDLLFLFTFCKPIQANFKDSFLIFNMKSFEMLSTPRDLSNSSQIFKNCYKIHNI